MKEIYDKNNIYNMITISSIFFIILNGNVYVTMLDWITDQIPNLILSQFI